MRDWVILWPVFLFSIDTVPAVVLVAVAVKMMVSPAWILKLT